MRYFESFAGVGGIGMGLPTDWELVGVSEVDKYASQVLAYHYPNVKNYGDITKIDWSQVPDFDVLTGGSPCQDFSIAGRRRGLGGSKSSLAWEYIRCLREKQPKHFLWENVKGVMSSRGGWDFANLLVAFSESGYSLWYQVINAKDFGIPQNRERIFVFGTRGEAPPEVLFIRRADEETRGNHERDQETAVYFDDSIPNSKTRRGRVQRDAGILQTSNKGRVIALALRNKDRSKHQHKKGEKYGDYAKNYHLEPQRDGLSFAVKETAHENYIAKTVRVGGRGSPHESKQNWDSYDIGGEIRRLTPVECERLMSWPDNWTRCGSQGEISDSQRYKMCGNGVVSAVVREIISHLI